MKGALWSSGLTRYHYYEATPRVEGSNPGLSFSFIRTVSHRLEASLLSRKHVLSISMYDARVILREAQGAPGESKKKNR